MTTVTYTAKRSIAPGAFFATGTDILADTLSDDFKSSATNLTGLVSGNYIYVTGFSIWPNYGWHAVNATSTSTAISVTTNLTDEAAGATITIQEYLHLYGASYTLETNPVQLDTWGKTDSAESISQGGLEQSILYRVDEGYIIKTGPLTLTEKKYWKEFLHSVAGKEPFTFDAEGTVASPDDPQTAFLDGAWTWNRIGINKHQVTFRVRII